MLSLILLICIIITLISLLLFHVSKLKFNYWKKKNVPYIKPAPIFGNFSEFILLRKTIGEAARNICKRLPDEPCIGAFYGSEPVLVLQDPELIKMVLTKDFYYFSGREISKYTSRESFTQNLFFTYGDRWKVLRQNLTPLFSSMKMKNMFLLIEKCSRVFEILLDQEIKTTNTIEVSTLIVRFTMDCIVSCTFGVNANTMTKIEKNPFRKIGEAIFDTRFSRAFKNNARAIWPAIFYTLGFRAFPQEINIFFAELMTEVFQERNYTPTTRNDFVDLLLKFKNNKVITGQGLSSVKSDEAKKLDIVVDNEFLVSNSVLLFAAGYETSATTLSFTLYELAKSPDSQERALEEVDEYLKRNNNKLNYECVLDCKYLKACFDEALRLYPVLGVLTREVTHNCTLNGLELEKGIRIHIPVQHLHYNPKYFAEPYQFNPDRFLGEEKRNIKPYTYMPFGEGLRICIGMRFAKMQMMAGIITLLKKYRVELADGMPNTIDFEPKSQITRPRDAIRLKFVERDGWEQKLLQ